MNVSEVGTLFIFRLKYLFIDLILTLKRTQRVYSASDQYLAGFSSLWMLPFSLLDSRKSVTFASVVYCR